MRYNDKPRERRRSWAKIREDQCKVALSPLYLAKKASIVAEPIEKTSVPELEQEQGSQA